MEIAGGPGSPLRDRNGVLPHTTPLPSPLPPSPDAGCREVAAVRFEYVTESDSSQLAGCGPGALLADFCISLYKYFSREVNEIQILEGAHEQIPPS